ncbi:TOX high mobility group box family member 4-like isoform X3 [Sitodiplosis mosellana]|uniref:TOX high mobility group box family member 4-like isoform X3 n=1 Tax=Sitodiplosis mosellana TaxID=263140 RepID=UPI0024451B14|nr:TOX high mobility group box family member 4-like isoform X3 [Sitodiplosis mosellana]
MSNTIPNIGDINSQHNKQLNTFHAPSFGDDDFDVSSMQMMQQTHQMDQYHPMPIPPQQMQDQQYMWQQQQEANQRNFAAPPSNMNMAMYNSPMMDPQMHYLNGDPVYNHQGQPPNHNHMQQMQPRPVPAQGPPPQQMHYQPTQQDQMLMMPPPYKSPPMNAQPPQSQIMSSPTAHQINQSPHYGVPTENGTTSEDSDGSVNTLKRPSPEPLNESPSKGGKASATAPKKPKPPRKKKKKDPNEPTKPVSAYALFFRDTQAAIKGQNPNASFGEVSTIVASMWDGLAHEHKEVYKKKTEVAKKEYLKTLAVYRASIVSKGNDVDSNKPSTPTGTISPQNQSVQQANSTQQSPQSLPNPQASTQQQQQQQQSSQVKPNSPIQPQLSNQPNANMNQQPYLTPQQQQQQQQQQQHQQQQAGQQTSMPPQSSPYQQTYNPPTNAYKSPPNPNQIDYNSMNMSMPHNQLSPIHQNVPQNHQMQMQHMGHPQQQVPMVRYGYEQQGPPPQQGPPQQPPPPPHNIPMDPYSSSPNHGNLQQQPPPPMHQIPTHHQPYGSEGGYNIHANDVSNQNFNSFQLNQQPTTTMVLHNMPPNQLQEMQTATPMPQQCIRAGCQNTAIAHKDWEDEYCSNHCVVLHCRNVFSNWVQSNNATSINPQQNFSVK